MPYATNNKLSTSPIEGGIEITPAEYADALAAMQEGKRLSVEGGQMMLAFPAPPEPEPEPEPTPAEILAAERQTMVCSPLQGQLALGETKWAEVEAIIADPETPWAMRVTIDKATKWKRLSQSIDQLAWLVGLDEFETDDLFRAAMAIEL